MTNAKSIPELVEEARAKYYEAFAKATTDQERQEARAEYERAVREAVR